MKVKILIVEDEVLLADEMEHALEKAGYQVIGSVPTGEEAIQVVATESPDLILMDIKLKGKLDGIETVQIIQKNQNTPIIYLTDISEKSVWEKARLTEPAAYLIKPFNELQIDAAFHIAMRNASGEAMYDLDPKQDLLTDSDSHLIDDRIYLRDGTRFIRVLPEEIIYVKGAGSYSQVFIQGKKLTLTHNIKQLLQRIPFEDIDRVHKSYLVNTKKITSFEGNRIFIDKIEIPIGESYKEIFMKKFRLI